MQNNITPEKAEEYLEEANDNYEDVLEEANDDYEDVLEEANGTYEDALENDFNEACEMADDGIFDVDADDDYNE